MPEAPPAPVLLDARDEGSGTPIVFLHGLGGNRAVWNLVLRELAPKSRVIAVDLRGHGRSPLPEHSTFTFDELGDDVVHTLDQLGGVRPFLAGLSAGGFLALHLALRFPERWRGLLLLGSAAQCDGHTRAMGEHWAETYQKEGPDAYALRLLKDLYYPDWIEAHLDVADRLREEVKTQDLRAAIRWGLAVRQFDVRPRIGKIRLPTLVLHGMDDRVVDSSHARYLRQSISGAALKLYARTGHFLPVERPEEVGAAIADFVQGAVARASAAGDSTNTRSTIPPRPEP